ncbi:MAG: sulfite exporter TauE/SafE family protein [Actinobacteria bacterium]|nr:sulfite exporter TauE/SafE family protein [Actinomycetota bacterium]
MGLGEAIAIFFAGVGAGVVNAAVGSGTLITFPVLLAFGYAPVTANVSNTIGLVPGSLAGAWAYRGQLRQDPRLLVRLAIPSVLGGALGAALLLTLPSKAFRQVVPFFIIAALVLVVLGPRLSRTVQARPARRSRQAVLVACLFATGVYGGYFGAAQGVIVLSLLGLLLAAEPQEVNGIKNVLVALVNLVSGVAFAFAAHVAWGPAGLIAAGSVIGGTVGARIAKTLPAPLFRAAIVGVATIALVRLLS